MRLYSVFPIAWSAFRMGYGYDRNSVVGEVVDNLVRESTNQQRRVRSGSNECAEFQCETLLLSRCRRSQRPNQGVAPRTSVRRQQTLRGSGKGPNGSQRRSSSIWRLATSQASSLAEPDSRAATRRLISAVQAEAASGSKDWRGVRSKLGPSKSRRSASARTDSVLRPIY